VFQRAVKGKTGSRRVLYRNYLTGIEKRKKQISSKYPAFYNFAASLKTRKAS